MCAYQVALVMSNSLRPMVGSVAHKGPLSMGFSRQEYWSGLPFLSPGDLPNLGIKPAFLMSLALAGRLFTTSATWEACIYMYMYIYIYNLKIITSVLRDCFPGYSPQ